MTSSSVNSLILVKYVSHHDAKSTFLRTSSTICSILTFAWITGMFVQALALRESASAVAAAGVNIMRCPTDFSSSQLHLHYLTCIHTLSAEKALCIVPLSLTERLMRRHFGNVLHGQLPLSPLESPSLSVGFINGPFYSAPHFQKNSEQQCKIKSPLLPKST